MRGGLHRGEFKRGGMNRGKPKGSNRDGFDRVDRGPRKLRHAHGFPENDLRDGSINSDDDSSDFYDGLMIKNRNDTI